MLGRLALAELRDSGRDYLPHVMVTCVSCALFYAFGSISDQLSFIAGGVPVPARYQHAVTMASLVLSLVVGVTIWLLDLSREGERRRRNAMLLVMGMSRPRLAALFALGQALALALGLLLGLALGIMGSHVLVFVTAAMLSGEVVGFAPFLSGGTLLRTLGCFGVELAFGVLSGPHLAARLSTRDVGGVAPRPSRRRGRHGWVLALAAGVVLLCLSYARADTFRAWMGEGRMSELALTLALFVLGTYGVCRGLGGALARIVASRHAKARLAGAALYSHVQMADLVRRHPVGLAFVSVCLSTAAYLLVCALGMPGPTPLSYLSVYVASVLLFAAVLVTVAYVQQHVVSSGASYRILVDLGCAWAMVRRSIGMRVLAAFVLPAALGAGNALAFLVAGMGQASTGAPDAGELVPQGVLLAVALFALVLWASGVATHVTLRRQVYDELFERRYRR